MFDSTATLLTSLGLNPSGTILEIELLAASSTDERSGEDDPAIAAVIIPDG